MSPLWVIIFKLVLHLYYSIMLADSRGEGTYESYANFYISFGIVSSF